MIDARSIWSWSEWESISSTDQAHNAISRFKGKKKTTEFTKTKKNNNKPLRIYLIACNDKRRWCLQCDQKGLEGHFKYLKFSTRLSRELKMCTYQEIGWLRCHFSRHSKMKWPWPQKVNKCFSLKSMPKWYRVPGQFLLLIFCFN